MAALSIWSAAEHCRAVPLESITDCANQISPDRSSDSLFASSTQAATQVALPQAVRLLPNVWYCQFQYLVYSVQSYIFCWMPNGYDVACLQFSIRVLWVESLHE